MLTHRVMVDRCQFAHDLALGDSSGPLWQRRDGQAVYREIVQ